MSLTTATTTTCCFLAHETKNQEGFSQNGGGVSRTSPARISPAVPSVVVILAVALFLSGLLHLLVRFLLKRKHHSQDGARADANDAEASGTEATLQGQLRQLFHLHDAGLEQAVIDALPVFLYREVVGAREEPFDCAVCLCELAGDDELRLLPLCGHAFHVGCIDTWLLSSSTCPLCRGALFVPGLPANDAALFDLGELTVRLGKFKNVGTGDGPVLGYNAGMAGREEGETSTSNLDARRCYSMGSYQYVLAEANLQVSVHRRGVRAGTSNEVIEGKRICAGGKGDSFSVSKIWQWRKDDLKLPVLAPGAPAADVGGFQWPRRSGGDK